jgi:Na+/melibiose symporter-like transporter
MLVTYTVLYSTVVVTSTTLGGVMVEAGNRFKAAGRMTAQRIAMFRVGSLLGGPIGGWLASYPFFVATGVCAAMHLALVPLFAATLHEPRTNRVNVEAWRSAGRQLQQLVHSHTLLAAAGMIFLIAAAPGFGTPLFFYQRDYLHFSKQFIGNLELVTAATGLLGAVLYYAACRRLQLGVLVAYSIVIHALGTLFYFFYRTPESAVVVSGISGITGTLAMLPVYDLAARATPRGSEALGYSVMMSVWNFTNAMSDWTGSWLFDHLHRSFIHLIWVNAGTTLLALIAVPFLPKTLLRRRDDGQDE